MDNFATAKNYRPGEVAEMFRVSVKTVYNWVDQGKMEAEKIAGRTLRIPGESIKKAKKNTLE